MPYGKGRKRFARYFKRPKRYSRGFGRYRTKFRRRRYGGSRFGKYRKYLFKKKTTLSKLTYHEQFRQRGPGVLSVMPLQFFNVYLTDTANYATMVENLGAESMVIDFAIPASTFDDFAQGMPHPIVGMNYQDDAANRMKIFGQKFFLKSFHTYFHIYPPNLFNKVDSKFTMVYYLLKQRNLPTTKYDVDNDAKVMYDPRGGFYGPQEVIEQKYRAASYRDVTDPWQLFQVRGDIFSVMQASARKYWKIKKKYIIKFNLTALEGGGKFTVEEKTTSETDNVSTAASFMAHDDEDIFPLAYYGGGVTRFVIKLPAFRVIDLGFGTDQSYDPSVVIEPVYKTTDRKWLYWHYFRWVQPRRYRPLDSEAISDQRVDTLNAYAPTECPRIIRRSEIVYWDV